MAQLAWNEATHRANDLSLSECSQLKSTNNKKYDIIVTVQGHEHSKKSYLITLLKNYLEELNINVQIQKFAIKEKENYNTDKLVEKLKSINIIILEQNT